MELTPTMIYLSATLSFIFLCIGIIAGWNAKDFMHDYYWSQNEQLTLHPEMYDEQGNWLSEELLHVKFIKEDELDETADE